ncbi:DUF2254 domain-containing protein [Pseudomonas sp. MAG002Y]|uniref:DUF2254 domain-containing protein n=1 Tax=Pseudomonas sp. MAG002Y TaxID=2678690 RepID=UPI001C6109AF|nr:DUF2254 domain-containing protein [Pseudomonas sp. MAG002Y]MBW5413471.1 DUF2254 domain-containing protein [Pseudomonas sp. MAG002Y]
MVERWKWFLLRKSKRPWFRATLFSVLGVVTALLALVFAPYIPDELPTKIGADAVDNILGIIASSMLAVTTFSLSTTVSAYSSATNNVTPRATSLLVEDPTTQNALSTFIGSFIFSLVGIVALSTGLYGAKGRVILFAVTLSVIVLIIYALLRWIDRLSSLGRVGETTAQVERVTLKALQHRLEQPYLGGNPLPENAFYKTLGRPVYANRIGYIQHLDMPALAELTKHERSRVYVNVLPGSFVDPGCPLAWVDGLNEQCDNELRNAFVMGEQRTFEHDPRFGLSVMAEIASRALSPGFNDQGTAIDVIGRAVRVLACVANRPKCSPPVEQVLSRIYIRPLDVNDLFDDLFTPIARDGAAMIEVNIRLQKALFSLSHLDNDAMRVAAVRQSELAYMRASQALAMDEDRRRLEQLRAELKREY